MNGRKDKLFSDFSGLKKKDWIEKIREELKGKDPRILVWETKGGVSVDPFYTREDLDDLDYLNSAPGSFPYTRGINNDDPDWRIRKDINFESLISANEIAIEATSNGADSLGFMFKNARDFSQMDMENLFKNLSLEEVEINFEANKGSSNLLKNLTGYIKNNNIEASKIMGSLGFDPLSNLNLNGKFCRSRKHSFDKSAELVSLGSEIDNFRVISINARDFHNAGSTISQVLGFALAQANEYLSELSDRNIPIDTIAKNIKFNFAVGSNYFMEIAKFRAARYLWSLIVKEYNPESLESGKMLIHAETSQWNKTLFDRNVNMLRATTESMSAILGGAHSLNVFPYDKLFTEESEFSTRIARNIQILLKEESFFNKVVDPLAGSYYVENMTDRLINDTWEIFLDLQKRGGYINCFLNNYIQDSIGFVSQQRDLNISTRKEILLGTNQFPNQSEQSDINIKSDTSIGNGDDLNNLDAQPLVIYRGAQAFEEMRLRTEAAGEKIPKVFLFSFGNQAMRKARATFSSNFFACAGFKIIDQAGFDSIDMGIEAFNNTGAEIVVLCSSDDDYKESAIEIFRRIKDRSIVFIAGYPKEIIDDLKSEGISNYIHIKSNVLEVLNELQEKLGID